MNTKHGIFFATFGLLMFWAFIGTASATTIYVPDNYTKIQWAVDNASIGDTIIVKDGTYVENVDVNKLLSIQSENGHEATIVYADDASANVFNVTADYVNISGFTVEGGTRLFKAGIYLNSSYCNISNNDYSNNCLGVFLSHSNNNTILNNNCMTDGIRLRNSSYNVISHNNCRISLSNSSNNLISNNNCTNNKYGYGIHLKCSSNNLISDNNCSSNEIGINLWHHSNDNCISSNNCSSNNKYEGINLLNSNNNTILNNDCSNNGMETGGRGIALWASSNNFITGNKVSFNGWNGILLTYAANRPYSSNNKILRNNISNNGRLCEPPLASCNAAGISLEGSNNSVIENTFINDGLYVGWFSIQNEVKENMVNGKLLVYLENESDREIKGSGQVILINCNNITVKNSDLSHTFIGIQLVRTNNSKITENIINSNYIHGIYLDDSSNNMVSNNNINSNNVDGIHLFISDHNILINNSVNRNHEYGIYLWGSNNTLKSNLMSGNKHNFRAYDFDNDVDKTNLVG